eukprot:1159713-Pelagomonas_calceolata.AAC.1
MKFSSSRPSLGVLCSKRAVERKKYVTGKKKASNQGVTRGGPAAQDSGLSAAGETSSASIID